jgi:hypothetical protein
MDFTNLGGWLGRVGLWMAVATVAGCGGSASTNPTSSAVTPSKSSEQQQIDALRQQLQAVQAQMKQLAEQN